jgi:hypothetical protein
LPLTLNITRDKLKTTVLRGGHGLPNRHLTDYLLEAAKRRAKENARKLKRPAKRRENDMRRAEDISREHARRREQDTRQVEKGTRHMEDKRELDPRQAEENGRRLEVNLGSLEEREYAFVRTREEDMRRQEETLKEPRYTDHGIPMNHTSSGKQ